MAFQTELLDVKPYERILEVGTGSGYQVQYFPLHAEVFTIERQKLFLKTKGLSSDLGYNCMFYGDGYKGFQTCSF